MNYDEVVRLRQLRQATNPDTFTEKVFKQFFDKENFNSFSFLDSPRLDVNVELDVQRNIVIATTRVPRAPILAVAQTVQIMPLPPLQCEFGFFKTKTNIVFSS